MLMIMISYKEKQVNSWSSSVFVFIFVSIFVCACLCVQYGDGKKRRKPNYSSVDLSEVEWEDKDDTVRTPVVNTPYTTLQCLSQLKCDGWVMVRPLCCQLRNAMVNRKTGTFSMEVKKSVDKGVRNPKIQCKKEDTNNLFSHGAKGCATENTQRGEIHSAKGLLHLAQWCTGLTWGFRFRFCLLCMHGCVSVCMCEPLISSKHMVLNTGETAVEWSLLLLACWRGRRGGGIQVCVCVCVCLCPFKA